ncbi:nucleoside phosphorylase domain-containing protein [Aspergillus pseudocaelatus]|uniref:Nucleoside phosphorylase domain-containing protein n=1 Tax=Aspergillus pseudocaelatus TaxID=1825620 RepID=A0ABQ6WYU1_9EURO|nr:nucleoside phosphorylase domain-containing protein [Aspergillus pseudocaelatus]
MDYTHNDYTVAWVCALPLEMTAAKTILDKVHPSLPQPEADHNTYILGNIASNNVVVACLPSGVYGTTSAATVLAYMLSTFRSLRFGIPTPASGGVIQYDYGKTLRDGRLHRTGSLNKPPQCLLTAVSHIRSDFMMRDSIIRKNIIEVLGKQQKANKQSSKPNHDCLFDPSYDHVGNGKIADCSLCDQFQQVLRTERDADEPGIHYGLIASGNQAAGLMDQLPCLIIRGICDYCDSHKNKEWQGYAALTAAVYTAALLATEFTAEETACLQNLFNTDPADDKSALRRRKGERAPGTCNWILEADELKNWLRPYEGSEEGSNVLWLYGNPGTGKSTMAITLTEELPQKASQKENVFRSFDALWSVFMRMSKDPDIKGVYGIIDALDECDYAPKQ